jgi:hypothetical protein
MLTIYSSWIFRIFIWKCIKSSIPALTLRIICMMCVKWTHMGLKRSVFWDTISCCLLRPKVKDKVVLRPMGSRPVYPGIKHPSGAYDQIFITVWRLQVCWCGALSLKRGRVWHLPESQSAVVSLLSVSTIYILYVIKRMCICMYVCIYNIYKASVSPGSVQQTMPYY